MDWSDGEDRRMDETLDEAAIAPCRYRETGEPPPDGHDADAILCTGCYEEYVREP